MDKTCTITNCIYNTFAVNGFKLGMAMQLRQMRNDADNAHMCANMRICASANFGAWPSLNFKRTKKLDKGFVKASTMTKS